MGSKARVLAVLAVPAMLAAGVACSTPAPGGVHHRGADTSSETIGGSCGPIEIDTHETDARVLVLDAAARARNRDLQCGPPSDHQRVCRALWLTQQLDPVSLIVEGSALDARHLELLLWALNDGALASTGALESAFVELRQSTARVVSADTDSDLASSLQDRAAATILEPLREAEDTC